MPHLSLFGDIVEACYTLCTLLLPPSQKKPVHKVAGKHPLSRLAKRARTLWLLLRGGYRILSQIWFETTRIVYFVKLKHASRTLFNLKLQRTAFHSKNAPKKCSQSSPRAPKTSPKCLRELPGDVLRGQAHLQSGPGASPIRQSGQSVVNSSKVEGPLDDCPTPPNFEARTPAS